MKTFEAKHWLAIGAGFLADQGSKFWAVANLGHPDGRPDYSKTVDVVGELLRFQLAYNEGAAFSSRPQDLLPFLSPTIFFGLLTIAATVGLTYFYRTLPKVDSWSRLGTALILSGALGNLADRLRIGKVVDFIDSDFPDFLMQRWPTFNVADSCVTVGVALVLLGPVILKRKGIVIPGEGKTTP